MSPAAIAAATGSHAALHCDPVDDDDTVFITDDESGLLLTDPEGNLITEG